MRRCTIRLADLTDAPSPSGPRKIGHPATGLLVNWEAGRWRVVDGLHHLAAERERGSATIRCDACASDGRPCSVECIAR